MFITGLTTSASTEISGRCKRECECLSLCVRPVTDSTHAVVNLENASKYLIINCQVTFQHGCQVSKLAYVVVVFELLSFRSNTQGLWVSFTALKFIIQFMKKNL